jgi:GNAT superfamily N-acetyltransferase
MPMNILKKFHADIHIFKTLHMQKIIFADILFMNIGIRQIEPQDSAAITQLSDQLGYALTEEQITKNIHAVLSNEDHDAFVAVYENKVVGWIGVAHTIMIEMTPYCEINGLVIDEKYRGKGIGRSLIERAKQWGKEKGDTTIRLRCNVKRKETHLFYQHLGFIETKEQKNFEINI